MNKVRRHLWMVLFGIVSTFALFMIPSLVNAFKTHDAGPARAGNRLFEGLPTFVAHACGGIDGVAYSNSLNALDSNYLKGFRFFEVDINWTSDHQLVLTHDWGGRFARFFGEEQKGHVPTLQEFTSLRMNSGLIQVTFAQLADWLRLHPEARIVTDVKKENLQALQKIANEFPDLVSQRVVPQIFAFPEYDSVSRMGYKDIVLALYRGDYPDAAVLKFAEGKHLFAVSMPEDRGRRSLPAKLARLRIPTFVHTVNSVLKKEELEQNGVAGFYTDYLCCEKGTAVGLAK